MPVDSLNQTAEGIPDSNPKECALVPHIVGVHAIARVEIRWPFWLLGICWLRVLAVRILQRPLRT